MTKIRPGTIVLFAALLLIGACSSDSPTAPPPGGGGGGGNPPPTGASVTLSVSNSNPLVNSTATITASVTDNGSAVPDGTAVEFQTSFGTFVVGQATDNVLIKTTENGIATATLTATSPGQAVVTARVNNVTKQTSITFKAQSTDPTPGTPLPVITTIAPQEGPPEGGTVVTLRGVNFEGPVRVIFGDTEATVASVTSTEVKVIAPKVNFEVGEEIREVPITAIFEAGSTTEKSVQAPTAFRYQIEALTPQVIGISPSSGPNEGGTVISIIGSGFQEPVKVFFVAPTGEQVEAVIQQVTFNQIIALTPKASGLGAELANEAVTVRVINTLTGNDFVSTEPLFRYGPGMQITGISPSNGPSTGGTKVTIFGWGFDDPVSVQFGDTSVFPINVSGTEIVVITPTLTSPCAEAGGVVIVTNLEDGTFDISEPNVAFSFIGIQPAIVGISPTSTSPGSNIFVTVSNAPPGPAEFEIDGKTRIPTTSNVNSAGNTVYTVSVPTGIDFPTEDCGVGGERFTATEVDVAFIPSAAGCASSDLAGALTVNPLDTTCRNETPAASVSPSNVAFGNQDIATGATAPRQITVSNAGGGTLTVLGASSNDPQFTVNGTFPSNLTAGQSAILTTSFDPAAVGPQTGTITIATSEGEVTVSVSGNGI